MGKRAMQIIDIYRPYSIIVSQPVVQFVNYGIDQPICVWVKAGFSLKWSFYFALN